jgi:lipopolysaccharide export system ATP-binding protein
MKESQSFLEVDNLAKSYGGCRVVDNLSFSVKEGEVVGLLGPNGAGKTTAFYMTIGLISPDEGSVIFRGEDVTHAPIHKRAHMGMGYLAQDPSVFRNLTVEENIMCILETMPLRRAERKHRLEELLHELNLEPLAKKRASGLSGGERRRLEITRALVTNPSFLLLDEPFANIDPKAIYDVKLMIRHLVEKNISVLITDHNAREIFSIVDRCYLICSGAVMFDGTVDQLLHNEEAKVHYLGEDFTL